MIVLDTHVWLWWVNEDKQLLKPTRVSPDIASRAVDLAEHHGDPQDRIIIATTLSFDEKLISADSKFPLYAELAGRLID